ncbi:porin family protein, partial [Mesorhizobium sp. M2D.F.Ca.ET.178.01.1.1]
AGLSKARKLPISPLAGEMAKSQVKAGWTLGAGVAYAINKNWFAQVDYRYTDFGKVTTATHRRAEHQARRVHQHPRRLAGQRDDLVGAGGSVADE